MIIDINGYFGIWPYWPLRGGDPASMLAKMVQYKIGRIFISSLKSVFSDPQGGNAEIKNAVARHPRRFLPAFTYSPYAAGWDGYREDCEEAGICLIKLFPAHHTYHFAEEPRIAELLEFCGERKIPVLIPRRLMMSWRLPVLDVNEIGQLASAFPQIPFIIGAINYLGELQTALHIMRQRANVWIETSAMMAFREIESVVNQVGAERILHGSALPLQNPAIAPLKIQNADISDADKERIFFRNAERLFPGIAWNES
ncbi:MAG: hypothetical protein C4527_09835 [Candidatus Omnitrophota bacterium]|jgi:predicted TIM-barrel fold metal-dependent hydrolase|nr:MAG: hypothetical protein C4527_09835 [Candidatus Omnitrophota bacterium]